MSTDPFDSETRHAREVTDIEKMDATAALFAGPLPVRPIAYSGQAAQLRNGTPRSRRITGANARLDVIDTFTGDQATAMLAWIAGAYPDIFDAAHRAAL